MTKTHEISQAAFYLSGHRVSMFSHTFLNGEPPSSGISCCQTADVRVPALIYGQALPFLKVDHFETGFAEQQLYVCFVCHGKLMVSTAEQNWSEMSAPCRSHLVPDFHIRFSWHYILGLHSLSENLSEKPTDGKK